MKIIFLSLSIACFVFSGYATFQQPDILISGKDTFPLWCNPLESDNSFLAMRKRFRETSCGTKCWRGYVAEWTMVGNELYLTKLLSCCKTEDSLTALYKKTHPEIENGKGLKATWLDFPLLITGGKIIKMFHNQGYHAVHQKEIYLYFSEGVFQKADTFNYAKSLVLTLSENKKMLEEYLYSQINWKEIPKDKLAKDIKIELLFYWSGDKEGVFMEGGDVNVRAIINKELQLISTGVGKNCYFWKESITLKPDTIKLYAK